MRYAMAVLMILLCTSLLTAQALAQMDVDRESGGTAAQPTAPRVGPETEREEPGVRETRRRGAEGDEEGEQTAEIEPPTELHTDVYHVELPDVTPDDVVRAARVMAHANAVYAEHRADLMRAALDGDEAAYAGIQRVIAQETEAAARDAGIDLDTYDRVLRSVQQHSLVSQRFFATLQEGQR
jgi:hypothetical protein